MTNPEPLLQLIHRLAGIIKGKFWRFWQKAPP